MNILAKKKARIKRIDNLNPVASKIGTNPFEEIKIPRIIPERIRNIPPKKKNRKSTNFMTLYFKILILIELILFCFNADYYFKKKRKPRGKLDSFTSYTTELPKSRKTQIASTSSHQPCSCQLHKR